jgi:hypothetical protein
MAHFAWTGEVALRVLGPWGVGEGPAWQCDYALATGLTGGVPDAIMVCAG